GEPKHKDLVERIADISLAALEGIWTDDPDTFPADPVAKVWWEVWLRRSTEGGEYARFLEFADLAKIQTSARRLQFEDRIVLLAEASSTQLAGALDALSGDIVEVRGAAHGAAPFDAMDASEQAEWIDELLDRTSGPDDGAPSVCVLDTGVNRGHRLLTNVLAEEDAHTVNPEWGAADHPKGSDGAGHGTEMAGLAAYGNLAPLLASSDPFPLRNRVESVKILPPRGANDEALYGAITATAASLVEVQAPNRSRCFSLSVTAPHLADKGQPTSWSAAIDALATGRAFDTGEQGFVYTTEADLDARRLFVVSAGNLVVPATDDGLDHLERSDLHVAHDPAQAWNALTVGASTGLAVIDDDGEYKDWKPVARLGDLSPHSTTSVTFARTKWPLKPDVVFEGGNVAHDGGGNLDSAVPDLCLLTTHYLPTTERPLVLTCGTSPATAQVARLGAVLQAEYPDYLPETIRGLIVHSARWTKRM
ncbi:MAG: S8 family peptidase, partial [Planctomycetota bacterium]